MKKLLTMLLVLCMVLSMFSACGSTASSAVSAAAEVAEEPTEATEATEETPEEAVEEAAEEAVEEAVEEPAAPQRISYDLPLFDETETFSFWCTYRTGSEARGELTWWKQMEEAVNLDIDWHESSEDAAAETYSLMIAADDLTDVIWEANANAQSGTASSAYVGGLDKAVEDGMYLDLTDLLEEELCNYNYYLQTYPQAYTELVTESGRIVVAAQIEEPGTYVTGCGFVQEQLFEETGMDVPATVDEWYAFWTACRDQELVEVPSRFIVGEWNPGFGVGIAAAFGTTDNSTFLVDLASNEVFYAQTSDEFRSYMEFVAQAYSEGLIHKDFFSLAGDMTDIFANRFGTFYSFISFVSTQLENTVAVPAPVLDGQSSPLVKEYESMLYDTSPCSWLAISAGTEKLDVICTWLNWMYSEEGTDFANYGFEEGVSYEIVNGQKQYTPIMNGRTEDTDIQYVKLLTCSEGPKFTYANMEVAIASDVAKEMYEIANATSYDNAIYSTLPGISVSTESADSIASTLSDIETFVATWILQVETCAIELNDDTWAEYVATVEDMGLASVTDAYQAAYDAYINK